MVMGGVKKGGSGCICPESVLLKALVTHIVLARDEVVILDMEAGLEHLGRATAMSVDQLIVVVEPGRRSIETAYQIRKLASDIGVKKLNFVGNKIRTDRDETFLREQMPDFHHPSSIPQAILTSVLDYPQQLQLQQRILTLSLTFQGFQPIWRS